MQNEWLNQCKKGAQLAYESLNMVLQNPVLLSYYLIFYLASYGLFTLAYNILGHFIFRTLEFTHEFHVPSEQLLAEIVPTEGGLLYIALLGAIYMGITLRTFFSAACVKHTSALLHNSSISLTQALQHTIKKSSVLLLWSLCVAGVTLLLLAWGLLPIVSTIKQAVLSGSSLAWSAGTFFVLPFITLTATGIINSIERSVAMISTHALIVLSSIIVGLFLFSILLITGVYILALLPAVTHAWLSTLAFLVLNLVGTTCYVVLKTKLFHEIEMEQLTDSEVETPDYSQF